MSLIKLKGFSFLALSFLSALLVLFSFGNITQASISSTGNVTALCQVSQGGSLSWPGANGACPSGSKTISPNNLPANFQALCLVGVLNSSDRIYNAVTTSGQISCDQFKNDPANYDVQLINRSSVSGTPPSSSTTTTSTGTPATIKPTTSTPVKTSSSSSTTSSGSTSTVNNDGSCPEGFTSKGPLCIPNNPFGTSDGIAGKGTVGELATTIISILLGMAGIVAVIMVIIGGYHVMTARGNETQLSNGRKTLTNALIGLAIVIVSYAVIQAIINYLTKSQ